MSTMAAQDLRLNMSFQKDDRSIKQYTPAATPICYLLDRLPPEVRNRIYRAVLLTSEDIEVDSNYSTPALLHLNSQIRAEASSIYYLENTFTFYFPDYSCRDHLRFLQTGAGEYLRRDNRNSVAICGKFNFENMVEWLKHESQQNVVAYFDSDQTHDQAMIAAAKALDLVASVCGKLEWEEIVKMLEAYKTAMEAMGVW